MEKKKRLGKGLKDISHYFISSDRNKELKEEQSEYQTHKASSACHVVSITDPVNPEREVSLTIRMCHALCENGLRTLAVDGHSRFPGILFTLGYSTPGYLFSHFLKDCYKPDDLIYRDSSGLNILAPRLIIDDMHKLAAKDISLMLDTLSAIEVNTDIIVLRGYDEIISPLIEDSIYIIGAGHDSIVSSIVSSLISRTTARKQNNIGQGHFFERLKTLVMRGHLTDEEMVALAGKM